MAAVVNVYIVEENVWYGVDAKCMLDANISIYSSSMQ